MDNIPQIKIEYHCAGCEQKFKPYADQFANNFASGEKADCLLSGIFGRVLRGKQPEDFLKMSNDRNRKIVFLLDSKGLLDLVGLDQVQILTRIGYEEKQIKEFIEGGTKFKLLLLSRKYATRGTWGNLLDLVSEYYPEWAQRIQMVRQALKTSTYEELTRRGGVEREVRLFLEQTLNVNKNFSGDGYTRDFVDAATRIYAEYITPNYALAEIHEYALIDFPVENW